MADALTPHLPALLPWVPLLPLIAGGLIAFLPDVRGRLASCLAIIALLASCGISLAGLFCAVSGDSESVFRVATSGEWFRFGEISLKMGFLLDPLSAGMAAMVTVVATCIFIFSLGYMAEEKRFGRFFGFLSLFSGAMLAVVLSNSLLMLFMGWELVGLASYLLIGFYFPKPSAAAAAQKAFITTRVGDVAFFLGMIWLYCQTGTLLFYDGGHGLLETGALTTLAGTSTLGGLAVSSVAGLLLLIGAMGKSGQVPLHTWLPDAMEGPTPVSALIHAATMVAAGVFLIARTHPIFSASALDGLNLPLTATAWVGAVTALFAACVAMAQFDIKRILAYSTVSQLGFMMVALGTGGVAAAMFHLIAHAFFKALLFLSAGSVIHGCHEEQDIRKMGGLAGKMPRTFLVYSIGMMALAGFPFLFSGFWSKEAILHSAMNWPGGQGPFVCAATAALLTAFYMTRQALWVFSGAARSKHAAHAHESPPVMTVPLYVLAAGAILLSLIGTPAWPWFEKWLDGETAHFHFAALFEHGGAGLIGLSLGIVTLGVGTAWITYRSLPITPDAEDPVRQKAPRLWAFLASGMGFDHLYDVAIIRPLAHVADAVNALERRFFVPLMATAERSIKCLGWITRETDEFALNQGFNDACEAMRHGAKSRSRAMLGRPQNYLRPVGLAVSLMVILYFWLGA